MTLLDLIPGLKRTATTNGGEYAGPCPFCGGRDRFRVWPDQGTTGRYWCRGCGKHGDGIQLLRDRDGLSYRDACERLGVMPSLSGNPGHRPGRPPPGPPGRRDRPPRRGTPGRIGPGPSWQACQRTLAGPAGADCRAFLTGRGLKPETD